MNTETTVCAVKRKGEWNKVSGALGPKPNPTNSIPCENIRPKELSVTKEKQQIKIYANAMKGGPRFHPKLTTELNSIGYVDLVLEL